MAIKEKSPRLARHNRTFCPIPVLRFRHSLFQTFANPQNPQNPQRGNTTLSGLLIYVKAERIASSLL